MKVARWYDDHEGSHKKDQDDDDDDADLLLGDKVDPLVDFAKAASSNLSCHFPSFLIIIIIIIIMMMVIDRDLDNMARLEKILTRLVARHLWPDWCGFSHCYFHLQSELESKKIFSFSAAKPTQEIKSHDDSDDDDTFFCIFCFCISYIFIAPFSLGAWKKNTSRNIQERCPKYPFQLHVYKNNKKKYFLKVFL